MAGTTSHTIIEAKDIFMQFGAVKALDGADISVSAGECIGLVGHNGAGKSTIVNVINGNLLPHKGMLSYYGDDQARGIRAARKHGIRCVFQELSLFPNLTVAENMRMIHSEFRSLNWRKKAVGMVSNMLDEIFPNHGINCKATVDQLSIAQRQMVEIAMNFIAISKKPNLVILDEPTSSLDAGIAEQLLNYIRRFISDGGAVILISHMLGEILSTCTRIIVMKDGKVVANDKTDAFTTTSLISAMGSTEKEKQKKQSNIDRHVDNIVLSQKIDKKDDSKFIAYKGEIIGLAGLAGHGQTDMLLNLYYRHRPNWLPKKDNNIEFIAGDRTLNGVFPLWSILKNLSVSSLANLSHFWLINKGQEIALGQKWKDNIQIKTPNMDNAILSLSGGNQQKVLFARALATNANVILMDDPMRGVDIGTKQEVYDILRRNAENGRTFVWYSTEIDEIEICDRVYVFRDGAIVKELVGSDITEKNILSASFHSGGH